MDNAIHIFHMSLTLSVDVVYVRHMMQTIDVWYNNDMFTMMDQRSIKQSYFHFYSLQYFRSRYGFGICDMITKKRKIYFLQSLVKI